MASFVLLAVGLGSFAMALSTKDDINRIAVMVAGAIFLVWGFALAPLPFQLLVEISILVPVSTICLRCLGCGSTR
jgi:sulfite exporter TauE/SafE